MHISEALTLRWDPAPLRTGNATQLNLTFEVALSAVGGDGWVGFGFGESMVEAQLLRVVLPAGGPATIEDLSAVDGYAAPSPVDGPSRYRLVSDVLLDAGGAVAHRRLEGGRGLVASTAVARSVTFTRAISTFPGGAAYFSGGPITLVHSWHAGVDLVYHGSNRREEERRRRRGGGVSPPLSTAPPPCSVRPPELRAACRL